MTMKTILLVLVLCIFVVGIFADDEDMVVDENRGEHPLAHLKTPRACWFGSPVGCKDGYCWKTCNAQLGHWCWLAWNNGYGAWTQCSNTEQCNSAIVNGANCGQGNCDACGCSC